MNTINERIKARRKELGLSVDDISKITGINRATYYRYEKGQIKKIPTGNLLLLAKALKCSQNFLLGIDDNLRCHNDCDFCSSNTRIETHYGAIWIDNTDRVTNFKWTSRQCPEFVDCSAKTVNIINGYKINYCPLCGREI